MMATWSADTKRVGMAAVVFGMLFLPLAAATATEVATQVYAVPAGAHPHDVAPDPAPGGPVWYTAQHQGALGRLDPGTGEATHIRLGEGSAPHGVIVGPDGAPWITDGGLNAIVRVDPETHAVTRYPLPGERGNANLNTATFDRNGVLWFTGQNGIYGSVDPATGKVDVRDARARPLRHRDHAFGPGLVRIACRQPHRAHQHAQRRGDGRRTADAGAGRAADLVRQPRATVGQRMEFGPAHPLRARERRVEILESARRQAARLLGLRRRGRQGLGDRLRGQRGVALRSGNRAFRELPEGP